MRAVTVVVTAVQRREMSNNSLSHTLHVMVYPLRRSIALLLSLTEQCAQQARDPTLRREDSQIDNNVNPRPAAGGCDAPIGGWGG